MDGLDVLKYLKIHQGVCVPDNLRGIVPTATLIQGGYKGQKDVVQFVVDLLTDDKTGTCARHFPKYCPTGKKTTGSQSVQKIRDGFRKFVKEILLANKDMNKTAEENEDAEDLAEDIRGLIQDLQQSWLHWSENYEALFEQMRELLPLLEEQYDNPMLESIALLMEEDIVDETISDEYIETIFNAILALCQIYNSKVEKLHITPVLSPESLHLFEEILSISIYLYHYLNWDVFDIQLRNRPNTIYNISAELIHSINNIFYRVKEGIIKIEETPEV